MSTKERQYRMKSGSVIHVRGTNKYYSDLNITDEVAEKLLKVNPNRSVLFSKMPEGALERLQKEAAEEAKADAPKADETHAPVEEVEVNEAEEVQADAPVEQEAAEEAKADEDLTFTELREKYPHVKARSKKEFLSELKA